MRGLSYLGVRDSDARKKRGTFEFEELLPTEIHLNSGVVIRTCTPELRRSIVCQRRDGSFLLLSPPLFFRNQILVADFGNSCLS